MSKLALRSSLAILVLTSAWVKYQSIVNRDATAAGFDIGVAIAEVINAHGLVLRENPIKPPKILADIVYFERPECGLPSLVMPFTHNYATVPLLSKVIADDYSRRFIYLDRTWAEQNRSGYLLESTRHTVLSLLGLSRYVSVKTAIVVAEPPSCRPSFDVDWRLIWDSARHSASMRAKSAAAPGHDGAPHL